MQNPDNAAALLKEKNVRGVIVKNSEIILIDAPGIAPLLALAIARPDLKGAAAADKIVGRAAALLYVKIKASSLYAQVLSIGGREILRAAGIAFSYQTLTPHIENREGTGVCPMEQAVAETADPDEACRLLEAKLRWLKGQGKKL